MLCIGINGKKNTKQEDVNTIIRSQIFEVNICK